MRVYKPASTAPVFLLIFINLSLLFGCAEVAPPPGGEEDKAPPVVVNVEPADGATNVPEGNRIVFTFSEGITRPANNRPVFITPRPAKYPKLKWKSDRLIIELSENFAPDQTYVVSLSSDIVDWRRNKLDSSVTIAFSTGSAIDSGSVRGTVLKGGKAQRGILVGLYEIADNSDEIRYDSTFPTYLTQTDSDGSFRFRYLPEREYRLLAFDDINRDEMFNPEREPFAVTDRPVNIGGALNLQNLFLELTERKIDTPQIISAIYSADNLTKIRFTSPLDLEYLKHHPDQIRLISNADTNKVYSAGSFQESDLSSSAVVTALTDRPDSGSYSVSVRIKEGSEPVRYENLVVAATEDKTPPTLLRFTPDDKPHFLNDVEMTATFSEPIDRNRLTGQTFVLTDDFENVVKMESSWQDDFHLMFKPAELQQGRSYTMLISEFDISDAAGNLLGDSILEKSFSVLDDDSLGSVSGVVRIKRLNSKPTATQLTFTKTRSSQSYDFRITDTAFTVQLPAGKYLLSGFIDDDNDGQRGIGSVIPYKFAETFVMKTDTISVRARFETAGVEFIFE